MSLTELPEVRFRTEISVFLTVLRFGLRFEPNLRFGKNIIINIKFQLKSFNKTLRPGTSLVFDSFFHFFLDFELLPPKCWKTSLISISMAQIVNFYRKNVF